MYCVSVYGTKKLSSYWYSFLRANIGLLGTLYVILTNMDILESKVVQSRLSLCPLVFLSFTECIKKVDPTYAKFKLTASVVIYINQYFTG